MARPAALGPRKAVAARQMRHTAQLLDTDHPETVAGDHVRDAAKVLEHGSTEGATRHLDAAMDILTPRNLIRHGILDDDGHASAKHHLHLVNRHKLAVQDIADAHDRNTQIAEALRASRETIAATKASAGQPGRPQPAPPAGPQLSNAIELRNVSKELRDFRGRWTSSGTAVPAVGTSASPLGRKVSRKEMMGGLGWMAAQHGTMTMEGHRPPGFVGRPGSVFGKKLSAKEAAGASAALAPQPLKGLHPGQQAQLSSLTKSQRVIYGKLRKRGRAHAGAFLIARTFKPGMLESAVLANSGLAVELAEAWRTERRGPGGRWVRSAREMRAAELRDHLDRYHSGGELPRGHGFRARGRSALFVHHQYMHRQGDVTVGHGHGARPAAGRVLRPAAELSNVTSLAAWEHERRGHGGKWIENATAAIMNHPELKAMDAQDRAVIETHVRRAGTSDHTVAELHLADARRRATRRGAEGLEAAITRLHTYHRKAATEPLGIKPMISQAAYNRKIASEQARPRPAARVLHRQPPVPFKLSNVDLSARTALLERTPAPRGKPGGPGLYDVKGLGHTAYYQQIVKALIEKRGMPPSRAYAIARGAIRKWMRGGGHVHPEVRAAAAKAEAGEVAKQARAHTHTNGWAVADVLIELAADPPLVIDLFNPYHAPPGSPAGGTFTTAQGAGAQQAKGKAAKRKELTRKIAGLRKQIAALQAQLPKSVTHKVASRKAAKAQTPQQAAAAARAAAKAKSATSAPRKKGVAKMSPATIHAKIAALRATLRADIAQLRALH